MVWGFKRLTDQCVKIKCKKQNIKLSYMDGSFANKMTFFAWAELFILALY